MIAEKVKSLNIKLFPTHFQFAPAWLVLGVNNICNLHCKMCDVGTNNPNTVFSQNLTGTQPLNMPIELFKRIADEAAEHYPGLKLGYAFTEPLIYPHLEESLAYARSKNLFTSITTNALNLPQKASILAEQDLNELYISLDGPEAIHNYVRGHKSSFQRAVKGIDILAGLENAPLISIYCVITEWNVGHLQEFLDFFKDYPIHKIGFMHMNFTPADIAEVHNQLYGDRYRATESNMDEINISKIDLTVLWKEIQEIKKMNYPFQVTFSPELKDEDALNTFYRLPNQMIGKRCNDVFSNLMIKSDGSVIPAHGRCYSLEIGNIYQQDLKSIWNAMKLKEFRKTLMDAGGLLPACSRCCSAY